MLDILKRISFSGLAGLFAISTGEVAHVLIRVVTATELSAIWMKYLGIAATFAQGILLGLGVALLMGMLVFALASLRT